MDDRLPRKLAAILYADVAGYSRLTGEGEDATHRVLREYLDHFEETITDNQGVVVHYAGDAVLARFDAAVDAVTTAVAIQRELDRRNRERTDGTPMQFRIGVNLGDVIEDRGDIYGEGVNVAARLEALAAPGGICVSQSVRVALGRRLDVAFSDLGEQQVKNIADSVRAYAVSWEGSRDDAETASAGPLYRFGNFELDVAARELREARSSVHVEPQVFDVIAYLVAHAGRVVTKDELLEEVWGHVHISDSAIASRIKSARRAIGDDGKTQALIKTVHGRGVRFVAPVTAGPDASTATTATAPVTEPLASVARGALDVPPKPASRRPSIAILPFQLVGESGLHGTIAEALPHELISELARLRWLFVIARGSTFRYRSNEADVCAVGEQLNVSYCLTGMVEINGQRMTVTVELADTRDGGVVWSDRYAADVESVHEVRSQILSSIISTLEIQITANEARRARLVAPQSLDAWASYHLGLARMYRFNKADNAAAGELFARAVQLEPGFCRAHAGLSFVHFQNAFLRYTADPVTEKLAARQHAERSLEIDELDPFANLTMGRSFWLDGMLDQSEGWLARATHLCPNYAKSIYAQAWTETVSGRGTPVQAQCDTAISLSPLDPLLYAMRGTRSLSHLVRGEHAEAAEWGEAAARSPGAHVLIAIIAGIAHTANGNDHDAKRWLTKVRQVDQQLAKADFLHAFPFQSEASRSKISSALTEFGL